MLCSIVGDRWSFPNCAAAAAAAVTSDVTAAGFFLAIICLVTDQVFLRSEPTEIILLPLSIKTRRFMSVNWVACGMPYTKTKGTELGFIELQRSSNFFLSGGRGRSRAFEGSPRRRARNGPLAHTFTC